HLKKWDTPSGLGWQNQKFSLNAVSPNSFIVEAVPQAWSAGTLGPVTGPAMLIRAGCSDELKEKYAGTLKGVFLMTVPPRDSAVNQFRPTATRYPATALA